MNSDVHQLDYIAISVKSHVLLKKLLKNNPVSEVIMVNSKNATEAIVGIRNWAHDCQSILLKE